MTDLHESEIAAGRGIWIIIALKPDHTMNKSFRNTMHFGVLRNERVQGRALHAFESGGRVRDQEQNAPESESDLHHAPAALFSVREPRTRTHPVVPGPKE